MTEFAVLPLDTPVLPLVVRPMQLADIPGVLAIEETALPTPWTADGYIYELTRNVLAHYFVLEFRPNPPLPTPADSLLGYAGYWLIADEVHISIIATHSAWRGHGLGEWLLLSVLQDAWAWRPLLATLEVREHNQIAQSLYAKLGFTLRGRRKRYYKDTGEDAWLMTVEPFDAVYHQHLEQLAIACAHRLTHAFASLQVSSALK